MWPIGEIQQAGEKLGYKDADLREFMKEQQALEREREVAECAECAAARQQQKIDAEIEQKRTEAVQEQKRLEAKARAVLAILWAHGHTSELGPLRQPRT